MQRRLALSLSSLPLDPSHPSLSAWGLWGDDDELGTLNLLTPEKVRAGLAEVKTGETIPLNLPLDAFPQPMNPVRKPCSHHILEKGHANDDELHINTQGSSHWDGLRHYPYQKTLQYYNNITQADISGTKKIGIQNLAQKTITGRGVLLDWAAWAEEQGRQWDPFEAHEIPLEELIAVAHKQKSRFHVGDVLFIRTGWLRAYKTLPLSGKLSLPRRNIRSSIGIQPSDEMLRWHWDNAFAAVASDTVAYEAWPSMKGNTWGVCAHEVFLSGWGMPIGESWDLEELSRRCRERECWEVMIVSVPVSVTGGVASPSCAVAIL
jgi:kynurenine formamidase